MKISICSCLVFPVFPLLILASLIPFSGGSLFDFIALPLFTLYGLIRFHPAMMSLSIKWPVLTYAWVLLLNFALRFALANDSDFLIAGTGLRLLMPISFLVFLIDFYKFICKADFNRKEKIINSLLASYLLAMISIMALSFLNGSGEIGLGLSFPLYTENQIDRHVYGPSVAALTIFCCLSCFFGNRDPHRRQFLLMFLVASGLGLISSFASGSRAPLAMYFVVIIYILIKRVSKVSIISIFKGFALLSIPALAIYSLSLSDSLYGQLFQRTFTLLEAVSDPASDHSRGVVYDGIFAYFSNPNIWLLGDHNVVGAADSGPLNLFINGGIPLLFSFLMIWIFLLLALRFSTLKIFVVAIFSQFMIGSETFFIPRYFLITSFSCLLLALSVLRTCNAKNIMLSSSIRSFTSH